MGEISLIFIKITFPFDKLILWSVRFDYLLYEMLETDWRLETGQDNLKHLICKILMKRTGQISSLGA